MELHRLEGKFSEEDQSRANRFLTPLELASLEKLVLAKVREAARGDSLFQCPRLPEILSFWKARGGESEPRDWVREIIYRDRLVALLIKFLDKDLGHEMMSMPGICQYRLNYQALRAVLDPAAVLEQARTLWDNSPDLEETPREALRQFLQHFDPQAGRLG
jgi:hypothetical protein